MLVEFIQSSSCENRFHMQKTLTKASKLYELRLSTILYGFSRSPIQLFAMDSNVSYGHTCQASCVCLCAVVNVRCVNVKTLWSTSNYLSLCCRVYESRIQLTLNQACLANSDSSRNCTVALISGKPAQCARPKLIYFLLFCCSIFPRMYCSEQILKNSLHFYSIYCYYYGWAEPPFWFEMLDQMNGTRESMNIIDRHVYART